MIRERLVCFTRKFIRNIVWVFGQYSSTLSIWPLLLFPTFIRLICQPAAAAVTSLKLAGPCCNSSRGLVALRRRNRRKSFPSKEELLVSPSLLHFARTVKRSWSVQRPPDERPPGLLSLLGLSLLLTASSHCSWALTQPLSPLTTSFVAFNWIRNRFYVERSDGSLSGVNCFYILWKRSFYSPRIRFNTHLTQTLILRPRDRPNHSPRLPPSPPAARIIFLDQESEQNIETVTCSLLLSDTNDIFLTLAPTSKCPKCAKIKT